MYLHDWYFLRQIVAIRGAENQDGQLSDPNHRMGEIRDYVKSNTLEKSTVQIGSGLEIWETAQKATKNTQN